MKVAFRADAGSIIGAGHLSRCLTLADALSARGASCYFVTRDHPGSLADMIQERSHAVTILPPAAGLAQVSASPDSPRHASWLGCGWEIDAAQTLAILDKIDPDWIVVDHYALDFRWEKVARGRGRKIMVIDDLADREHDCDLLIDPGVDPSLASKYRSLTPPGCCLLIGPRFCILRPEFDTAKRSLTRLPEGSIPRRLVVLFGGNDANHSTLEALRVILRLTRGSIPADVIVAATNVAMAPIARFCEENTTFTMHHATDEVARLFSEADLAIGAGGSATYERLYLRLPSLLKPVAENQRVPLECMRQAGLIDTYSNENELASKLEVILRAGLRYPPDLVGNGVEQIVDAILDDLVLLKAPVPLDLRRTFHWLEDSVLRTSFLMGPAPERSRHFAYWRKQLADTSQRLFSIYLGSRHIGNAGLKHLDPSAGEAELWLYIGEGDLRGRGIGMRVVQALEKILHKSRGFRKIYLHVSRNNAAALRLYSRAGFVDAGAPNPSTHPFASPADVIRMERNI